MECGLNTICARYALYGTTLENADEFDERIEALIRDLGDRGQVCADPFYSYASTAHRTIGAGEGAPLTRDRDGPRADDLAARRRGLPGPRHRPRD
jgi:hypothetical protein